MNSFKWISNQYNSVSRCCQYLFWCIVRWPIDIFKSILLPCSIKYPCASTIAKEPKSEFTFTPWSSCKNEIDYIERMLTLVLSYYLCSHTILQCLPLTILLHRCAIKLPVKTPVIPSIIYRSKVLPEAGNDANATKRDDLFTWKPILKLLHCSSFCHR